MEKQEIHLADYYRILFGNTPVEFLLEVIIRTLILYISLLFVVRWLGKRMSGQLTIMELAVMLTLGAIVGAPYESPDRGILQGIVLLLSVLGLQKLTTLFGIYSSRFERLTEGKVSLVVKDGVLQMDTMRKERISNQQVFTQLRTAKIFNLGTVDRMYLEASGTYSIYKAQKQRSGLGILANDNEEINKNNHDDTCRSCGNCGYTTQDMSIKQCGNCNHEEWQPATYK